MGAYRRYQRYLNERRQEFPPNAFKLATAEWYYDPSDHRCPHDGWLESLDIAEVAAADKQRIMTIRVRLLARIMMDISNSFTSAYSATFWKALHVQVV